MRLVMIYTVTDDCTFWNEVTLPLVYASPEAAIVDFDNGLCEQIDKFNTWFTNGLNGKSPAFFEFAGEQFDISSFSIGEKTRNLPKFLTLDEWFDGKE